MSSTTATEKNKTIFMTDTDSDSGLNTLLEVEKRVEERVGKAGRQTWRFLHALPGHGALLGGAAGLAGVVFIGFTELVTACFAAYVSYRMFAYGESLPEAIQKTIRFQKGRLSDEEVVKAIPTERVGKEDG